MTGHLSQRRARAPAQISAFATSSERNTSLIFRCHWEIVDLNKSNTFTPCILLIPCPLTRVSHLGLRRTLLTGSWVHLMDRSSLLTFLMVILDIFSVRLSFSSQTWSYNFSKMSQFLVWLRRVCGEAAAEGGSWRRQPKALMCLFLGSSLRLSVPSASGARVDSPLLSTMEYVHFSQHKVKIFQLFSQLPKLTLMHVDMHTNAHISI